MTDRRRIAVVGAGMAGATCARRLADAGRAVTVFDKSRGVGGRMAVRRVAPAGGKGGWSFDHGAQYFTAKGDAFAAVVDRAVAAGAARPWTGRVASTRDNDPRVASDRTRYVGVPGMNGLCKHLAAGLDIRPGVRVAGLEPAEGGWRLRDTAGVAHGPFAAVVLAVPAPQAANLLGAGHRWADRLAAVRIAPTWSLMLGFDAPLDPGYDAVFIDGGVLSLAFRNDTKPGRPDGYTGCGWTLHADHAWSAAHLEADPAEVVEPLRDAFAAVLGRPLPAAALATAHRWRYAAVTEPLGQPCLWDPGARLGLCGDWCLGAKVEAAYDSGHAVADEAITTGRLR